MKRQYPFTPSKRRPPSKRQKFTGRWGPFNKPIIRDVSSANAKATRALMMLRKIKQDEEIKEHQGSAIAVSAANAADTWGTATILNAIEQGTAGYERIGTKIMMKSLAWRGYMAIPAAETGMDFCRFVIVYDRRPDRAAVATGAEIFTTDNPSGMIQSFNKQYAGRFQILFDRTYWNPRVITNQERTRPVKGFIKLNHKTEFNGVGALQTNFDKGQLLALAVTGQGTTHQTSLTLNIKVKYVDL